MTHDADNFQTIFFSRKSDLTRPKDRCILNLIGGGGERLLTHNILSQLISQWRCDMMIATSPNQTREGSPKNINLRIIKKMFQIPYNCESKSGVDTCLFSHPPAASDRSLPWRPRTAGPSLPWELTVRTEYICRDL